MRLIISSKFIQILVFWLVSNLHEFMQYIFIPKKIQRIFEMRTAGEEDNITGFCETLLTQH